MEARIELLIKLGLSKEHAVDFIKNLCQEAFDDGYSNGMLSKPAKIGESLGEDGVDFYGWWEMQINNEK